MRLKEAAERIGVSTARLRQLIKERRIQATLNPDPQGAFWTISEEQCERLLAARAKANRAAASRQRARRLVGSYPQPCHRCGEPITRAGGAHIHHKDGDPLNNATANLAVLHPACHAREHGWLDRQPQPEALLKGAVCQTEDVASLLGVSQQTVYRLVKRGELVAVHAGRLGLMFEREAVQAFAERRRYLVDQARAIDSGPAGAQDTAR